jgi:hypothetical protein
LAIDDKKYVLPSNSATYAEATRLCAERNMDLASFETLAEIDTVGDFLAELGLLLNKIKDLSYAFH